MRRNWLRVFLLCVACAVCLHGNCAAGNNDDNWVRYYEDHLGARFVNDNFVKVREYNGRKYLLLATRQALGNHDVLFDVERKTSIHLLSDSKIHFIELTKKGSLSSEYQALLQWAEQKYPSLINELREHNKNHPLQSEASSAGTQTVTANGDYGFVQTLGDGPVQYAPRSLHRPPTYPVPLDNVMRYYVSAVPASGIIARSGRKLPPTTLSSNQLYIIYDSRTYSDFSSNNIHAVFSYDDATNTFTLYGRDSDDSKDDYVLGALTKIRIISKDDVEYTVEGINLNFEPHPVDDPLTLHLKYVKALPGHKSDGDGYVWNNWDIEKNMSAPIPEIQVDGENYGTMLTDADGANAVEVVYAWGGWNDYDELGLDGLFAFLARKGKVGYAPATGPSAEYFW